MTLTDLQDYQNRFANHINKEIKFLVGVDKSTGMNIFENYKIIDLSSELMIQIADEPESYEQYVNLVCEANGNRLMKSIVTVVDNFEKPKIGKFAKRDFLIL